MIENKKDKNNCLNSSQKDNEEYIDNALFNYCTDICNKCKKLLNEGYIHDEIYKIGNHIASNPILLSICIALTVALIVLALLLTIFIIISATFAFTGVMLIQVMILAAATSFVSSIFICIAIPLGFIGICIYFINYVVRYTKSLLQNCNF